MKKFITSFAALTILVGCTAKLTESSENGEVSYIDLETDAGVAFLDEIVNWSFDEMTDFYSKPEIIEDGKTFIAHWKNILIKEHGSDLWCETKFRFNDNNNFLGYTLYNCE